MQIDKWSVLAGLRFVLAFIVAVNHLPDFVPVGIWALVPKFGAFEAVLGFLLISGFSIGTSYQKEPKAFLRRRTLRIYPIYIAALALTCVVFAMEHGTMPSAWLLVANVLFLNQIVTSDSFVGPAWSLALEFWLYLLTPLLFSLKPSTLQLLARVSFVAFLAHTCGRTLFHWNYYSGVGYGLNLVFLSFIWLAGFRLAREPQRYQPILNEVGWMFALHILLAISIQFASSWKRDQVDQFLHVGIDSFALQAFTLLAVLWTFKRIAKSVGAQSSGSAALRLLGDISYPLYIIHIPAFYFLKQSGFDSPILYLAAAIVGSFLLSWGLDRYSQQRHQRSTGNDSTATQPQGNS